MPFEKLISELAGLRRAIPIERIGEKKVMCMRQA